ncbi:NAD-binding protein [bacterium]|nr:NAD-binding protein [bacterium]
MEKNIGFIGLGAMGKPMAINLVKKGYRVTVYDLRSEPMAELKAIGATTASSCKAVAECSDVVITMLLASSHVENAVLGVDGVLEGAKVGLTLIDMSSIEPSTTRKVGKILFEKGIGMLDGPVARGVKAAVAGTLAIFVGGDKALFEENRELLGALGTDVSYVGALGCGAVVKIVNQLVLSLNVVALAEGMVLGVKGGVDPEVLLTELEKGSANSFALQNHYKNFVMKDNFGENIFSTEYILKDLRQVVETAKDLNVPLLMGSVATQIYEMARASGMGKNYFPVVVQILENLTGVRVRNKKT